jgi:hypothetical protein
MPSDSNHDQNATPFGGLIDAVCETDRRFFENHPEAQSYMRPAVPGEHWPVAVPSGAWVCVVRLGPGVRARQLIEWPTLAREAD